MSPKNNLDNYRSTDTTLLQHEGKPILEFPRPLSTCKIGSNHDSLIQSNKPRITDKLTMSIVLGVPRPAGQ